jgi:hypothetical protein
MVVGGQRYAPAFLHPTYPTGGWVDPSAGLEGCRKSCPTGIQSLDSQTPYKLGLIKVITGMNLNDKRMNITHIFKSH